MTVQALLESLLIHIMSNEAYAAAQHKQRINGADIDVFLCLFTKITTRLEFNLINFCIRRFSPGERAAVAQHINKGGGNHTIYIQN